MKLQCMGCTLIACLMAAAIATSASGQVVQYWVNLDGGDINDQSSTITIDEGGSADVAVFIDGIPQGAADGCEFCVRGSQVDIPVVTEPAGGPAVPHSGAANNSSTHPNGLTNIPGGCNFPDCFALPPVNSGTFIRIANSFSQATSVPVTGPTYIGQVQIDGSAATAGVYTLHLIEASSIVTDENSVLYPITFTTLTVTVKGESEPPFIIHETGEDAATAPCSGYVDPRRESNNGVDHNQGMSSADILFSEPVFGDDSGGALTAANFTMTDCDGEAGPTVADVTMIGDDTSHVRVTWDGFIALQKWTTLKASVWNAAGQPIIDEGDLGDDNEPDRIDLANLPADIDQNERVQPLDLLRIRQRLSDTCTAACPDCGGRDEFYFDIDRNGAVQALDLLRWRQLWFGTGSATMVWQGAQTTCDRP